MVRPNKLNVEEGESTLKAIRELLGISQEEFARRIGVSVTTISRWETGKTPATFTVAQMKAFVRELKTLEIDVDELPDDLGRAPRLAQ